jgi:hypothetical protein
LEEEARGTKHAGVVAIVIDTVHVDGFADPVDGLIAELAVVAGVGGRIALIL